MQFLAMGAIIIKEQVDNVWGVRRTEQRRGEGINGGQVVLRFAAAIDGRGNKVNLAGRHGAGNRQTDQGQSNRGQTADNALWGGAGGGIRGATSVESSDCLGACQITKAASSRPVMCVAMQ